MTWFAVEGFDAFIYILGTWWDVSWQILTELDQTQLPTPLLHSKFGQNIYVVL